MPAPDEPEGAAPADAPADAEAEATFAAPPTVAALRKARKTVDFDVIGGSALLVGLAWPVVGALAFGPFSLLSGLLAGFLFFFATAFAAGMLEAAWDGGRGATLAFLLTSLGASVLWSSLPTWGFAAMGAIALLGTGMVWRLETRHLRAGLDLSDDLIEAMMALPVRMDKGLQRDVDAALGAHQQVRRTLATIGHGDTLAVPASLHRAADDALLALVRQTRRQVEVEAAIGLESRQHLAALKAEGRARLHEISSQIQALRDELLALVVRRDPLLLERLGDKIEQLHLTSKALDEVERDVG